MIDAQYVLSVITWMIAWSAIGLAGRDLMIKADSYRHRQAQRHGKVG